MAHISHLFFPMDSLIICDSTDKIFLYASEFIWLPLPETSVESTEPGPEAAMHAAIMTLPSLMLHRWDVLCYFCLSLYKFLYLWLVKGLHPVVYLCTPPVLFTTVSLLESRDCLQLLWLILCVSFTAVTQSLISCWHLPSLIAFPVAWWWLTEVQLLNKVSNSLCSS